MIRVLNLKYPTSIAFGFMTMVNVKNIMIVCLYKFIIEVRYV